MLYGSIPDPDNAGKSQSFACITKFESADTPTYAIDYRVHNYYGELTFLKGSAAGKIGDLNTEDLDENGPWTDNAEPLSISERFAKSHKSGNDAQRCTVARPVGLKEGMGSGMIMDLKEDMVYILQTGYKIWSNVNDEAINYEEDGEPFEIVWELALRSIA